MLIYISTLYLYRRNICMLYTSIDNPGRPNPFLMTLSVLQGYLKHPLWFMMSTIFSIPKFKKQVPKDLPAEFLKVSVFPALFYIRLKEKLGQDKAYEIMRVLILCLSSSTMQGFLRTVEAPRTFENLISYQQFTNKFGPTRWNKMEVLEQSEHRYEYRVHNCMFHDFNTHFGIPEMTKLMCGVDNSVFNTYLPEKLTFHRNGIGNRIADGSPTCHFVIENNFQNKN